MHRAIITHPVIKKVADVFYAYHYSHITVSFLLPPNFDSADQVRSMLCATTEHSIIKAVMVQYSQHWPNTGLIRHAKWKVS